MTASGGHSPLESGVNIEVIDFNATLDDRYCVNGSCVARRGLYNLYVPVAGHTPTAPVLIRFRYIFPKVGRSMKCKFKHSRRPVPGQLREPARLPAQGVPARLQLQHQPRTGAARDQGM